MQAEEAQEDEAPEKEGEEEEEGGMYILLLDGLASLGCLNKFDG